MENITLNKLTFETVYWIAALNLIYDITKCFILSVPEGFINRSDLENDTYNIRHKTIGKAIIVNNKTFQPERYCNRDDSDKDVAAIYQALSAVGFDVYQLNDVTKDEIMQKYREGDSFFSL